MKSKYINYVFTLICIIIIIIIIIFIVRLNYKKHNYISENFNNPTYYIFWTGGYDSTFRILQALLIENAIVYPIYLSGIIDNMKDHSTRRKNNKQEFEALKKIYNVINNKYPNKSKNLKSLIIIPNVKLSKTVNDNMYILYKKGYVRRPICQYGSLAQVAIDMNVPIELAVENEPHSSIMYRAISDKVSGKGINRKINNKTLNTQSEFYIYKNFRFPTLSLTKKDMLKIAKKNGFDDILRLTWSCWYPINNRPCNRCVMCRERII